MRPSPLREISGDCLSMHQEFPTSREPQLHPAAPGGFTDICS
jgi:hypothetical protein